MAAKGPIQCQRETWAAYYASPEVVERFGGIVDALVTEAEIAVSTAPPGAKAPEITGALLAAATHNIQIAQENVFGRDKPDGRKGAKLPAVLFSVPSDGVGEQSALYSTLSAVIEHAVVRGLALDDEQLTAGPAAYELLEAVRLKLADNRQLPAVRVHFGADIPQDKRDELGRVVECLGGSVAEAEQEATHIVGGTEVKSSSQSPDDVWFRTLSKHDGHALVHWWYTPDSYDAWVAADPPYNTEPEDAGERAGAWHVSLQWIEDSGTFNEWANEEDYESSSASGAASSGTAVAKRRAHAVVEGEEKRLRVDGGDGELPEGVQAHDIHESQPAPGNRKRNEFEPLANGELAAIPGDGQMDVDSGDDVDDGDDGQEGAGSAPPEKSGEADAADTTDAQLQREENARRLLVEQTQEVIIPSYAAWFSLSSVHENERRALPEFFNSRNMSKTPTIYMEYRNFMVNTYRLNPAEYLTVTACRRNLAGDVCAIMRVHAFLEQWGLVNYQADADTKPSTIGPPFTGHFRISADTPRGLVPFQPSISSAQLAGGDRPVAASSSRPAAAADMPAPDELATRRDIYSSPTIGSDARRPAREVNAAEAPLTTKDVFCHTCGANCTAAYYHCVKALRQRVDLCALCYQDGRFPGTLASCDFVKVADSMAGQPGSGDEWADQETLLLLEGIEMYDDDWNRIAEHVGTRSREECVLHFLKLPIVDPYDAVPLGRDTGAQSAVVPFSRADNPVMSVVAFLASNVNPGVAAAAAKAALAALTNESKVKPGASEGQPKPDAAGLGGAAASAESEDAPAEGTNSGTAEQQSSASMDIDDEAAEKPPTSEVPAGLEVAYASSIALGAAAAKAAKLAEYEERQLEGMVHRAVELQMNKLELKMRQFEEMEAAIEQERKDLARQRQQLVEECWALKKKMGLFESGAAGRAALAGGSHVFKANDNASQVARAPTAPPKPATSGGAPQQTTEQVQAQVPAPAPAQLPVQAQAQAQAHAQQVQPQQVQPQQAQPQQAQPQQAQPQTQPQTQPVPAPATPVSSLSPIAGESQTAALLAVSAVAESDNAASLGELDSTPKPMPASVAASTGDGSGVDLMDVDSDDDDDNDDNDNNDDDGDDGDDTGDDMEDGGEGSEGV
ncbi:SWI/SNF and RSC complex subunit Ssr2 [Coemansia biformis]|uniref:SWI/SNF and RSC complex subunit Ssr2 n=1 Tax=Coemansia biformis TaxID=1286918 RepID=A0A9W7YF31_9FUNG|nr:SWI/SNF and RSC complex subunit Ssr2 [Coemansia biformis]